MPHVRSWRAACALCGVLLFLSPIAAVLYEALMPPARSASGNGLHAVYLTFDDGPSAVTDGVLDVLKQEGVPATFFVVGTQTPHGMALYSRILDEGHSLGLHTYTHNVPGIYASLSAFRQDYEKLAGWIEACTGVLPKVCRMAGGSSTRYCPAYLREQILTYLVEDGYSCFDWDIDAQDSGASALSARQLFGNVVAAAKKLPGQDLIILLHDDALRTTLPEALPGIIEYFRSAGYAFRALFDDAESAKRILPAKLQHTL